MSINELSDFGSYSHRDYYIWIRTDNIKACEVLYKFLLGYHILAEYNTKIVQIPDSELKDIWDYDAMQNKKDTCKYAIMSERKKVCNGTYVRALEDIQASCEAFMLALNLEKNWLNLHPELKNQAKQGKPAVAKRKK